MNSIQFNDYQSSYRPAAEIAEIASRLRDKSYQAGRREGLAQLEQSTKAAREEGIVIGEARAMRGQIAAAAIWICVGIVFAIIGGPVVAGWLA